MNFFKTKPRTPPDLVRGLRDSIGRLESGSPGGDSRRKVRACAHGVQGMGSVLSESLTMLRQASDDISKNLQQIKAILHGDAGPSRLFIAHEITF